MQVNIIHTSQDRGNGDERHTITQSELQNAQKPDTFGLNPGHDSHRNTLANSSLKQGSQVSTSPPARDDRKSGLSRRSPSPVIPPKHASNGQAQAIKGSLRLMNQIQSPSMIIKGVQAHN